MPKTHIPKARRRQLLKSELLLALAVKTEIWASEVTDDSDAQPFAQWPADNPFKVFCKTYDLTPADLAKVLRTIGDELEKRAMRAGYDEAWLGVDEDTYSF